MSRFQRTMVSAGGWMRRWTSMNCMKNESLGKSDIINSIGGVGEQMG